MGSAGVLKRGARLLDGGRMRVPSVIASVPLGVVRGIRALAGPERADPFVGWARDVTQARWYRA
jgi:hypothetical protein